MPSSPATAPAPARDLCPPAAVHLRTDRHRARHPAVVRGRGKAPGLAQGVPALS
jgi:hypothetical protein